MPPVWVLRLMPPSPLPPQANLEESMSTLQFATRARAIKSRQEMRTELVQEEPMSEVQQVYERVTAMLQAEHRLSWAVGAQPTPAGLLDCLSGDACWEVLSAYRQGKWYSSYNGGGGGRMHKAALLCSNANVHPTRPRAARQESGGSRLLAARDSTALQSQVGQSVDLWGGIGGHSAACPRCAPRTVLTWPVLGAGGRCVQDILSALLREVSGTFAEELLMTARTAIKTGWWEGRRGAVWCIAHSLRWACPLTPSPPPPHSTPMQRARAGRRR